jgi:hypothetical protein
MALLEYGIDIINDILNLIINFWLSLLEYVFRVLFLIQYHFNYIYIMYLK